MRSQPPAGAVGSLVSEFFEASPSAFSVALAVPRFVFCLNSSNSELLKNQWVGFWAGFWGFEEPMGWFLAVPSNWEIDGTVVGKAHIVWWFRGIFDSPKKFACTRSQPEKNVIPCDTLKLWMNFACANLWDDVVSEAASSTTNYSRLMQLTHALRHVFFASLTMLQLQNNKESVLTNFPQLLHGASYACAGIVGGIWTSPSLQKVVDEYPKHLVDSTLLMSNESQLKSTVELTDLRCFHI